MFLAICTSKSLSLASRIIIFILSSDLKHNGLIERQAITSQLSTKISNIVRSNDVLCPDLLTITYLYALLLQNH
jgi:hypothetical protein